jgi:carboxypeptidase family protein
MKRVLCVLLFLFINGATAAHAAATGKLVGTATDQDGQPITQATVRAVDVISGKELASIAVRPDASYAFDSVPEGVYYLAAQVPGYRSLVSKTVTVKAGETTPLDLAFQSERTWISRVFTSGAALWSLFASLILTLWGPRIYACIHRPKLALDIEARPPYSHWINPQFPEVKEGVIEGGGTAKIIALTSISPASM